MTNEEIIQYYVALLIMQYVGLTNVQTITFSGIPVSGVFQFRYGTLVSQNVAWNANNSTIQTVLQNLTGVPSVTVAGGLSTGVLNLTLGNSPTLILGTNAGTMVDSGPNPVTSITSGVLVKAAGTIQALARLQVMNQLPLIIQNAFNLIPTIQTITFQAPPTTGVFQLSFGVTSTPSVSSVTTADIAFGASNNDIRVAVNAVLPSGSVAVSGSLANGSITLAFSNANPTKITVVGNTTTQSTVVTTNLAFGSQLDTIGKYVGVSRNGNTPSGPIVLSDSDFFSLIQFGIIRNNFGSSLATITQLLFNFFGGQITVFDNRNMQISYVLNGSGGISLPLIYTLISQNLLPKPMGVQIASVIVSPGNLFSFRTYDLASSGAPFNTYDSYALNAPWLTYSDAIGV